MGVITQEKTADPREYTLCVNFMKVGKLYYFDFVDYPNLEIGDHIIVNSRTLGQQMGEIKGFLHRDEIPEGSSIHRVLRPATPADLLNNQQWQEQEVAALIECREKAAELGSYKGVKFVAADYNYNGTTLTIYYYNEERFRISTYRLRSAMYKKVNARIEFRAVGARDVAKLQEGFGSCGIPRCCSTFLTDFSMISINMAKAQGLTLNPNEITGVCGRLRCCLIYEYEQYVEARRQLPRIRKRVGTQYGDGRVVEIHPLEDAVTVRVNEENFVVPREELRPLDEYEALKAAAASPCSKNESGGCDCGSKRPRGSSSELMAEMGVEGASDSSQERGEQRQSGSKRRRNRRKGNRPKGQAQNQNQPKEGSSESKSQGSGKGKRRGGKRRRNNRNKNRGDGGNKPENSND